MTTLKVSSKVNPQKFSSVIQKFLKEDGSVIIDFMGKDSCYIAVNALKIAAYYAKKNDDKEIICSIDSYSEINDTKAII